MLPHCIQKKIISVQALSSDENGIEPMAQQLLFNTFSEVLQHSFPSFLRMDAKEIKAHVLSNLSSYFGDPINNSSNPDQFSTTYPNFTLSTLRNFLTETPQIYTTICPDKTTFLHKLFNTCSGINREALKLILKLSPKHVRNIEGKNELTPLEYMIMDNMTPRKNDCEGIVTLFIELGFELNESKVNNSMFGTRDGKIEFIGHLCAQSILQRNDYRLFERMLDELERDPDQADSPRAQGLHRENQSNIRKVIQTLFLSLQKTDSKKLKACIKMAKNQDKNQDYFNRLKKQFCIKSLIQKHSLSDLKATLKKIPTPDELEKFIFEAIPIAVQIGSDQVLKELISRLSESTRLRVLNQKNDEGETLLIEASKEGYIATMHLLAAAGANLSDTDNEGNTVLHHLVNTGKKLLVEEFLNTFTDASGLVNIQNRFGIVALHLAADHGMSKTIDMLQDKGADMTLLDNKRATFIHHWVENNNDSNYISENRIKFQAYLNHENCAGLTPFLIAIQNSHIVLACACSDKELWEQPNSKGETAVHIAVRSGNLTLVNHVLRATPSGVSIYHASNDGKTPLREAVETGRDGIIQSLIAFGARTTLVNRKTELHIALEAHYFETAKILIENFPTLFMQGKKIELPREDDGSLNSELIEFLKPKLRKFSESDLSKTIFTEADLNEILN